VLRASKNLTNRNLPEISESIGPQCGQGLAYSLAGQSDSERRSDIDEGEVRVLWPNFLKGPADSGTYAEFILSCRLRRFAIEVIPERNGQVKFVWQIDRKRIVGS
jgi:hypothetical protein